MVLLPQEQIQKDIIFYAYYGPFSDGSLITITCATKFNYVGQFAVLDPFVISGQSVQYAQILIKTIFNQDNPPAITDIPQLSSTLANFATLRDISRAIALTDTYSIVGGDANLGDWSYIRYYRLGALILDQGGYSAWVKILGLGNGYPVSVSDNNAVVPSIYSIDVYIYSSNNFAGIRLSGPSGQAPPTLLCYYNGFCVTQSIGPAAQVYIVPDEYRPEEIIYIWIRGAVNQGVPFSMGVAGGGGYYGPYSSVSDSLPSRGWLTLSMRRSVFHLNKNNIYYNII